MTDSPREASNGPRWIRVADDARQEFEVQKLDNGITVRHISNRTSNLARTSEDTQTAKLGHGFFLSKSKSERNSKIVYLNLAQRFLRKVFGAYSDTIFKERPRVLIQIKNRIFKEVPKARPTTYNTATTVPHPLPSHPPETPQPRTQEPIPQPTPEPLPVVEPIASSVPPPVPSHPTETPQSSRQEPVPQPLPEPLPLPLPVVETIASAPTTSIAPATWETKAIGAALTALESHLEEMPDKYYDEIRDIKFRFRFQDSTVSITAKKRFDGVANFYFAAKVIEGPPLPRMRKDVNFQSLIDALNAKFPKRASARSRSGNI